MKLPNQKGLTLIELLVALVVLITLVTVGVPSMKGMLQSNRVTANTNLLVSSLHQARSEAVKQNRAVSICPQVQTDPDTGNWSEGWYLTQSDSCELSADESAMSQVELSAKGLSVEGEVERLTFRGDGTAHAKTCFELELSATPLRVVEVNAAGSVSSHRAKDEQTTCQ